MPEAQNWARRILEKRGIPILPADHWIYREGTSMAVVQITAQKLKVTSLFEVSPAIRCQQPLQPSRSSQAQMARTDGDELLENHRPPQDPQPRRPPAAS
jgi:hypothetical protein